MKTTCVSPFPATRWTLVSNASGKDPSEQRRKALEMLCRDYWYPIYSFARRSGKSRQDSEDLTQGFFTYLLEKELFAAADPGLGKLRTFLLTAFQRYMGGIRAMQHALKRGGGQEIFSLDVDEAERHFGEPADTLTPHEIYDRQWALSLLHATLQELGASEAASGRREIFTTLEAFLNPRSHEDANYDMAAETLGMNPEAVRKAVSRLRGKFRDLLRKRISTTLDRASETQVDEELIALKSALRM